jgi:hypothetical protein
MDDIFNRLFPDTFTLAALKFKVRILKSYMQETLFAGSIENLNSMDPEGKGREWIKTLDKKVLSGITKENFNEVFKSLEARINVGLMLYLAFPAEESQIKEIGLWLRKKINKDLIFDVKVDPSLIGGCALVYKGVYKDFSLKGKITEKKGELLNIFRESMGRGANSV